MNVTEAFQRLKLQYCTPPPKDMPRWHILRRWDRYIKKWPTWSRTYHQAVDTLEQEIQGLQQTNLTQADRLHSYQNDIEAKRRTGQVSEQFRKQPNKRWEGSYTQKVFDGLQGFWNEYHWRGGPKIQAARDLLRDYHETMHVVYEERDSARRRISELEIVRDVQLAEIKIIRNSSIRAQLNHCSKTLEFVTAERDDANERLKGLQDQTRALAVLRDEVRVLCEQRDQAQHELHNTKIQRDRAAQMEEDRRHEIVALRCKVAKAVLTRAGFEECI